MGRTRSTEGRGWRFETTPDRAGLALAAGGGMGGAVWCIVAIGGGAGALAAISAFILGTLFTAIAIGALAAPLWLVLHIAGWRQMRHAALLGAAIGFTLFLSAQTSGFGLGESPPADMATTLYRWASAVATSLLLAGISAAIAVVMWAVAYRRID